MDLISRTELHNMAETHTLIAMHACLGKYG